MYLDAYAYGSVATVSCRLRWYSAEVGGASDEPMMADETLLPVHMNYVMQQWSCFTNYRPDLVLKDTDLTNTMISCATPRGKEGEFPQSSPPRPPSPHLYKGKECTGAMCGHATLPLPLNFCLALQLKTSGGAADTLNIPPLNYEPIRIADFNIM